MAKGFKHGAGGSNPLNFKVVSNPQPANPSENVIWMDTDTEITGWAFSASDPSVVSVGCRESVSGHYLNASGTEVSSANWRITDYTKLPENSKKIGTVFSASATSGRYHAFYDGNKNFISSAARKNGTNSFSVPANAVYIRMTVHNNDNMSFNATVTLDEGFVWFLVGTSSPVSFNALKKNSIQVYPLSAKQRIDGAWADKTAKSWQGGKWVDWVTYLYNYGDERTDLTGGFSKTAGNNTGTQTLTKNSDHLYLVSEGPDNAGSNFTVATSNSISMSNFSTLCAKVDFKNISSTHLYLGADPTNSILPYDGSCKLDVSSSFDGIISLDISALSGSHYVYVGLSGSKVSNSGNCRVYEVYLK